MTAQAVWRLFAGKGGVGKTTCAAASAVAAADRGARVLVISTDPAHSLGDALAVKLGPRPRRVALGPRAKGTLHACELDADAALDRFIDERRDALRAAALRGTYLDAGEVDRLLRLSLPGVDELVGLLEVDRLAAGFDEVVVDTAPCGHTLRLLATPALLERLAQVIEGLQARHRTLARTFGVHRQDATDRVIDELAELGAGLHARLRDPDRCRLAWVLLPEALAVEETADGLRALEEAGIPVEALVVNRLAAAPRGRCDACAARVAAERLALRPLLAGGAGRARALRVVPALAQEPRGPAALRAVARALAAPASPGALRAPAAARPRARPAERTAGPAPSWLEALVPAGVRLLLVAGKGGVGKTSTASAVALHAAARDPRRRVLLLSVDPAHSLGDALDAPLDDADRPVPGAPRGLRARELDAVARLRAEREAWLAAVDGLFDGFARPAGDGRVGVDASLDRQALRDLVDLAPPGIDELLAVLAVVEALGLDAPPDGAARPYDLVVLDTAPTGHALRLLEMPARVRAWVQALLELLLRWRRVLGLGTLAEELTRTARRLRLLEELVGDPARTGCLVVARAADLPRLETARALGALWGLGLRVAAVLVNALTAPGCARCRAAAKAEGAELEALRRDAAFARAGCAMIRAGARVPPPRGPRALTAWAMDWTLEPPTAARRRASARRPTPSRRPARRAAR